MIFTLQPGSDIYLGADPASATTGFLFQTDPSTLPQTFMLSDLSWTDPEQQGYFVFFAPNGARDWSTFAQNLRSAIASEGTQLSWFAEPGGALTFVGGLQISGSGNPLVQNLFGSASFAFPPNGQSITLTLTAPRGASPVVTYDDGSDSFLIPNNPGGNPITTLQLQSPGGQPNPYSALSQNVVIPMSGPLAGTMQTTFQLGVADLGVVEAGVAYFGPPPSSTSTALAAVSFPVVRPAGTNTVFNLDATFDPVQQTNVDRTFMQITDQRVGSYFGSAVGVPFDLVTVAASDDPDVARFGFANRPVVAPTDATNYYLALTGRLDVAPAQTAADDAQSTSGPALLTNALLCGTMGTEFFTVAPGDTFRFVPYGAAYDNSAAGNPDEHLTSSPVAGSTVVTSWVRYETNAGNYVAQPQPSPLFNGGTSTALKAQDDGSAVHVLDFFPLPSWTASSSTLTADAGNSSARPATPAVPLAPFAGVGVLDTGTAGAVEKAQEAAAAIEAAAIYPQRRTNFLGEATLQVRNARNGAAAAAGSFTGKAMTPQGLIAEISGNQWSTLQLAQSPPWTDSQRKPHAGMLQFTSLGAETIAALQQNQVFLVTSTSNNGALYGFTDPNDPLISDDEVNIADWIFSLSPDGDRAASGPSAGIPPILILKFYKGAAIADLCKTVGKWTSPSVFNDPKQLDDVQAYIEKQVSDAIALTEKDPDSIYANFAAVVSDPNFTGLLALNCNLQFDDLPGAIKGIMGGMKSPGLDAFRAHHVGVAINDTESKTPDLVMTQSALFGLVDYESTGYEKSTLPLDFQVEYLRALFMNAELRQFSCKVDLTVNNLFNVDLAISQSSSAAALRALPALAASGPPPNVVVITGSYQAHAAAGDSSAGGGVYSFVAAGKFVFDFDSNPYLETVTLTKLQFSFDQETPQGPGLSTIASSFAVSGSMVFKQLDVLDIFSFEQLVFTDVAIGVTFTLDTTGKIPTTRDLGLTFSPGNLRFDFGQTATRPSSTSLLALLPFKLKSFLYSENANQTLESLGYSRVTKLPGVDPVLDTFNYALIFDLDLGSVGAMVGSLAAFKFSVVVGWQIATNATTPPITQSGIAFGIQLPEADGKLEIKIEGVIDLLIEEFILKYVSQTDDEPDMLVVGLHNASLTILGQRIPPTGEFEFALFVPEGPDPKNPQGGTGKIGWIAAYDEGQTPPGGDSKVFELKYLGGGQRVGPDPSDVPTNFADFKTFMTTTFWKEFKAGEYGKLYHPDQNWLVLADIMLLSTVEVGFVFYDATPFYSLTLNVAELFDFEITYTKISDSIGMFYATFALPDSLRTYQVGVASLTLPSLAVTVYTNGNFKVDLGFPAGTDWSRCFQIQAQAGPVPVTGAGGFYVASLSSATSPKTFQKSYDSILAFGFAARLGVGKDFTMGPLSAGVSVTFFGIIEGAAGYLTASADEIFKMPDALMLTGNFGIIGQLYGKVDFKIISASVNVTLSASIGIVMVYEPLAGNDGSILLYIEASVEISVEVKINLGFFSIRITFSFSASIHFQWQLTGPTSSSQTRARLTGSFEAAAALTVLAPLPLITGLTATPGVWFLPEISVVFADTANAGTPYFVASLGMPYDNAPAGTTAYSQFAPFEAVTTQLTTWALMHALNLGAYNSPVTLTQLSDIDQKPDELVGWLDYGTLLEQLSVFTVAATVPAGTSPDTLYAAVFPMPCFATLATNGRTPADLSYRFDAQNLVSEAYITNVEAEFDQLYVNQTAQGAGGALAAEAATTPLAQSIFLEYFKGLIRGAVHELLQTLQGPPQTQSMNLDALFIQTVAAGGFASLSGLMSSSFRGGVRLPYTSGLTVPGATAQTTTNALYALLWQEFPVGGLTGTGNAAAYTVSLSNDSSDPFTAWFTSSASWLVTQDFITPYQGITAGQLQLPTGPVQLPFTRTGPQYFTYENPTVWTGPAGAGGSLRPFPAALARLQAAAGTSPVDVVVQQRKGASPGTDGVALQPSAFTWVTQITVTAKTIPAGATGYLPDLFSINGTSEADELLLAQIVTLLQSSDPALTVKDISVLYQVDSGTPGLTSVEIVPTDVFVLRTNTTTVSEPPPALLAMALEAPAPQGVPVGSTIGPSTAQQAGFLQIVQQAVVTNASGYYLRYADAAGKSFPDALLKRGFAPITLLIRWNADGTGNTFGSPAAIQPFYNGIVLNPSDDTLIYYAETTNPALAIQYPAVAPGAIGLELAGTNTATMLVPPSSAAFPALGGTQRYTLDQIVTALHGAGITTQAALYQQIALLGSAAGIAQLDALYALLTYQILATTGYQPSPLSAPIQPQNPDTTTAAPVRVSPEVTSAQQTYQVFAPLYNFATANTELPAGTPPNRYASIGDDFSIGFFVNDAFGNQLPQQLTGSGTNFYFDPIVPVDQWTGIVTSYGFGDAQTAKQGTFFLLLSPKEVSFKGWTDDQFAIALQQYQAIRTQIEGPGVSFYAETNFALDANGNMARIALDAGKITALVDGMTAYLADRAEPVPPVNPAPFPSDVLLTLAIPTGGAALPPVFELSVLIGVERDAALIAPSLKDNAGNITFPAAQNVASAVAADTGGTGQPAIGAFAWAFVTALPALTLSVGLNGAQQPQQKSSARLARTKLAAMGVAGDGGSGGSAPQSLFAVQAAIIDVSIGTTANSGPFYSSPTPLDNALNSGTVTMPVLDPPLQSLPVSQVFTDVDLDQLNRAFFAAVDAFLAPASAARAFELAQVAGNADTYTPVATGRESIADKYTKYEMDRMFASPSPFSPSDADLTAAKDAFGQQMRAALASAYVLDTVVQFGVTWNQTLPAGVGDLLELFGQIGPTPQDVTDPKLLAKISLSTSHVPVDASGTSLLTFLFGTTDVAVIDDLAIDLQYAITHVQYFVAPEPSDGSARPSIWLQLVTPVDPATNKPVATSATPHVGPAKTPTTIPVVFRQYPTPPTFIAQSAQAAPAGQCPSPNPLVAAAAWEYQYSYQAQVTAHDRLLTSITYNTNLTANGDASNAKAMLAAPQQIYTLFEALARFSAAYPVISPILLELTSPDWLSAAQAFASLVTDVVNNSNWNPVPTLGAEFAEPLAFTIDDYIVTDVPQDPLDPKSQRTITMTWQPATAQPPAQTGSWEGAQLAVVGIAPDRVPYPAQQAGTVPNGVTDVYTPTERIESDYVGHQVDVDCLNVLAAENAIAALRIQRNALSLPNPGGGTSTIQDEYVYMTPIVRPSQPATPFVDNLDPIDITTLPGAVGMATLSQQIFTMMNDLLREPVQLGALLTAMKAPATPVYRRVKVACGFQFPVLSAAGVSVPANANVVMPVVPVVLARSFVVDVTTEDDIAAFAKTFASAIVAWTAPNGVTFGPAAQPGGGRLVFDVTLYAELSGANTPVLRLRDLFLMLTNIDPASALGAPETPTADYTAG